MTQKENTACRNTRKNVLGHPINNFGRWFCGHSPSRDFFSSESQTLGPQGLHSSTRQSQVNPDEIAPNQHFGVNDFLELSNFQSNFQEAIALSGFSAQSFSAPSKSWAEMFVSWCSQDWLQPIPGLLERGVSAPLPKLPDRRSEFFHYGSRFLQYKAASEKVGISCGRSCSRIALFLAGALQPDILSAQGSQAQGVSDRWGSFFGKQSRVRESGPALSVPLNLRSPLAACHEFLLRLSAPPRYASLDLWGLDQASLTSPLQFPWDQPAQPWSTPLQVTTAIAFALPVLMTSAPVQYSSQLLESPLAPQRESAGSRAMTAQPKRATTQGTAAQITDPAAVRQRAAAQRAAEQRAAKLLKSLPAKKAPVHALIFPAQGEFTSGYGWRWGRMHRGIDIAGPVGTPVVAAAAGKVIAAGWDESGFGHRVEIQHPNGTVTLYGHNHRIVTHVGAQVRQGQQIAEMGSSGRSTGPHVHFQVHPSGKEAVDPMIFLAGQKLPSQNLAQGPSGQGQKKQTPIRKNLTAQKVAQPERLLSAS